MKRIAVVFAVFCIAPGLPFPNGPGDVGAQTPARNDRLRPAEDRNVMGQISEAMRYLSVDPERSLEILSALDRRFPGNERILSRIGYVFQAMDKADSAAVFYRRAIAVNPRSLEAGKSLGLLYLSTGHAGDARETFEGLLRANAYSVGAYRAVGTALREAGRYDEALDVYRKGCDRSKRHVVLSLEVADLLETTGDYTGALDEYLDYIGDTKRNYTFTKAQVLELLRNAGDKNDNELDGVLEDRLARGVGNRFVLLDVLAARYVERGLLEAALDKALLADEEGPSDGATLVSLSERLLVQAEVKPKAQKRRYLELGIRALDAFTARHPRAAGTDRAKYLLASLYERLGSGDIDGLTEADRVNYLEQAVAEYSDLSRRYPNSEYAERAYIDRGDLLLRRLGREEDALEAYRSGAVNSRRYSDIFTGRIGDFYLGLGRFDDAKHYFETLVNSGIPNLVQAGTYYTGLRLAIEGNYTAARDTLTYLAEEVPASRYANDAIETAWVIEEGLQFHSASMKPYFEALRAEMVGDTTVVVGRLEEVAAGPVEDALRPRALFKLGTALYDRGDLERALSVLRQFLQQYPENDLRPDVQRKIAAVYEYGYEEYDRALREYENVLLTYPDYAFLDEVRDDVRRLRFIVNGEEYEN